MRAGVSIGGSWPPDRPPAGWIKDPYGTPPGPGDRLAQGYENCDMGWTWSSLTARCEPPPHEPCAAPAYWSWERFQACRWGSNQDCAGTSTGLDENGLAVGACVPLACDAAWMDGGYHWSWIAMNCVPTSKPQPMVVGELSHLAQSGSNVGHLGQRQPRMSFSGHHPSQMRAGKRRTVREIAGGADYAQSSDGIVGKRTRNGWVRVTPLRTAQMPSSIRGVRRYNQMVAGVSVAGGGHMGAADTSGNRGVRRFNNMVYAQGVSVAGAPSWKPGMPRQAMMPSSLRGVRRYNQMVAGVSVAGSGDPQDGGIQVNWGDDLDSRSARHLAGPTRRAAHRRQMANRNFMQRARPQPSPLGWR